MFKHTLGWTSPKLRDPYAADRWTWLVLAAYTSCASRTAAGDLRLPWERPTPPERLTPARVRRALRHLRTKAGCPAAARNRADQALDGRPTPQPPPSRPPRRPHRHRRDQQQTESTTTKTRTSTSPKPRRTG